MMYQRQRPRPRRRRPTIAATRAAAILAVAISACCLGATMATSTDTAANNQVKNGANPANNNAAPRAAPRKQKQKDRRAAAALNDNGQGEESNVDVKAADASNNDVVRSSAAVPLDTASNNNAAAAASRPASTKRILRGTKAKKAAAIEEAKAAALESARHRGLKEEDQKNDKNKDKQDPEKGDKNNNQPDPTPRPTISPMPTPTGSDTLVYIGEGGTLGMCEGDCDSHDDCRKGLKCFTRDKFEAVPNCEGWGTEGTDYCACFDDVPANINNGFPLISYIRTNGAIARASTCGEFSLESQNNFQDFIDICSRPIVDEDGDMTGDRVKDVCRYTCGVCIDIEPPMPPPMTASPTDKPADPPAVATETETGTNPVLTDIPTVIKSTPRPTKRPTPKPPTYAEGEPTPYPTLTAWPTITAYPTVTAWPTITFWPTVTMWPTITAYPTVTFYPTAEENNPNAGGGGGGGGGYPGQISDDGGNDGSGGFDPGSIPAPRPAPGARPTTRAPITPRPTPRPTISMAPTRYWPAITVEVAIATQVLMFTEEGGHIRVGKTKWTRADYVLDAIIYATTKLLEERLDGLEVRDYLDDDSWQDDDEVLGAVTGRNSNRRLHRNLVDMSLPIDKSSAYLVPDAAPHGTRRLLVLNGTVLELNWDKSALSHISLEALRDNPDLTNADMKQLEKKKKQGIQWSRAYLRYWIYQAEKPNEMISQKKTARITNKVTKTIKSALKDGDYLAWVQYADPKIAGASELGKEHKAPINVMPLPISPYADPIVTGTLDPIRIAGLVLFLVALFGSICLAKLAIRRKRKREAKAYWGSLETDKDIDALLNVGLILPEHAPGGGDGSGPTSKNGTSQRSNSPGKDGSDGDDEMAPVYSPNVLARKMAREELGYSQDNSMLMGGYQRTMQIAIDKDGGMEEQDAIPEKPAEKGERELL